MKDCDIYQEMISAMLDGELSAEEEASLHAHMLTCDECKLMYSAFAGISGAIYDDLVEPPAGLASGTMYKIDIQQEKTKRRLPWGRFTLIAACLALVVFGMSQLKMGGSSSENAEMSASDRAFADSDSGSSADYSGIDSPTAKVAESAPEAAMEMPAEDDAAGEAEESAEDGSDASASIMGEIGEVTDTQVNESIAVLTLVSVTSGGGDFVITNVGETDCEYGDEYHIEILVNSQWHALEIGAAWDDLLHILESGASSSFSVNWSAYTQLEKGTYRLVKQVCSDGVSADVVCEFSIP